MKTTITSIDGRLVDIEIVTAKFHDGNTAVLAKSNGAPYGRISVNVPDFNLSQSEIIVKTYSENVWVPQLLELMPDVFQDTGRRLPWSWPNLQIWRFTPSE